MREIGHFWTFRELEVVGLTYYTRTVISLATRRRHRKHSYCGAKNGGNIAKDIWIKMPCSFANPFPAELFKASSSVSEEVVQRDNLLSIISQCQTD